MRVWPGRDAALREALFADPDTAIGLVDAALSVRRCNEAFAALFATGPGCKPNLLALGDRARLREAARLGRALRLESRIPAAPGACETVPVALSMTPLGRGRCLIRVPLHRMPEVEQAAQNRAQRLQAIGQVAGAVAHDFNNLLMAITAACGAMEERPLSPALRSEIATIRASAARGAALVRQLLAFARQQVLLPRRVEVNQAVRGMAELIARLIGRGVTLELDLEEPGRAISIDSGRLDQVLLNLAVNARDAMPEGGTLTLRTGHATLLAPLDAVPDRIPPGRYVTVTVADTGTGIDPAIVPKLFEPFFSTRTGEGGTGLGLATVHGVVRQSGGFIRLTTAPGEGTTFRLYFPRDDAMPEDEPPGPPASVMPVAMEAGRGRILLLVEDEAPVRRLLAAALRGAFADQGWSVVAVGDGEEALALPDMQQPGAVGCLVTDILMPGLHGPALLRAIRERQAEVPAVMMSGYVTEALRTELALPRTVFLAKPFEAAALIEAIRCACAMAGTEAAPSVA